MACKYGVPALIARGGGSIVNIGSVVAIRDSGSTHPAYAACRKAGCRASRWTWLVSTGRQNVRVNAVLPGMIKSPIQESVGSASPEIQKAYEHAGRGWATSGTWPMPSPSSALLRLRTSPGTSFPVDGGATVTMPAATARVEEPRRRSRIGPLPTLPGRESKAPSGANRFAVDGGVSMKGTSDAPIPVLRVFSSSSRVPTTDRQFPNLDSTFAQDCPRTSAVSNHGPEPPRSSAPSPATPPRHRTREARGRGRDRLRADTRVHREACSTAIQIWAQGEKHLDPHVGVGPLVGPQTGTMFGRQVMRLLVVHCDHGSVAECELNVPVTSSSSPKRGSPTVASTSWAPASNSSITL